MKSKNIHVLKTDKPSRLVLDTINSTLYLTTTKDFGTKIMQFQNIYITNSEEIKEGDYFIAYSVTIDKKPYVSCASEYKERKKEKGKIILTTDQNLIKDGVQAIDDEFLEWFVKNPSCDEIKVEKVSVMNDRFKLGYKIIIPKEESKPFKQMQQLTEVDWEKFKKSPFPSKKVPKQETLEEVSERFSKQFLNNGDNSEFEAQAALLGVKFGAKWQQEKMYSEEDLREAFRQGMENIYYSEMYGLDSELTEQDWFEQFKKK